MFERLDLFASYFNCCCCWPWKGVPRLWYKSPCPLFKGGNAISSGSPKDRQHSSPSGHVTHWHRPHYWKRSAQDPIVQYQMPWVQAKAKGGKPTRRADFYHLCLVLQKETPRCEKKGVKSKMHFSMKLQFLWGDGLWVGSCWARCQ